MVFDIRVVNLLLNNANDKEIDYTVHAVCEDFRDRACGGQNPG